MWTQEQADALRANIAKGVKKLKMGEEELEFRTLAEMRKLLADMESDLAGISGGGAMSVTYPDTGRGL